MEAILKSSDEIVPLPPEWEMRRHVNGRIYFANHLLRTTQWQHPITGKQVVIQSEEQQQNKSHEQGQENQFVNLFPGSRTAMELLQGQDLDGRVYLITGGNSGIGYYTAEALACHGGHVIIACRNVDRAEQAVSKIKEECEKKESNGHIEAMILDLASFKSIKHFANNFRNKCIPLHVLICNAAVLGSPWQLTEDNIEYTFAVNYLGHFLLIDELKDVLMSSSPSRVIMVSSESHRFVDLNYSSNLDMSQVPPPKKNYWSIIAYNQSKLCCLMLSMELNRRYQSQGITSIAVHPGNLIYTSLCQSGLLYRLLFWLAKPFSIKSSQGAAPIAYCATASELEGVNNLYINGCNQCEPSSDALDRTKAELLWNKSMNMIHGYTWDSCNDILRV